MGDLYIIILVYGALLVDRSAKYISLLFLVYVHEKFAHDHHVLSWIVRPFCVLLFIVFTLSCIVFSAYSRPLWAASYFDKDTERVIHTCVGTCPSYQRLQVSVHVRMHNKSLILHTSRMGNFWEFSIEELSKPKSLGKSTLRPATTQVVLVISTVRSLAFVPIFVLPIQGFLSCPFSGFLLCLISIFFNRFFVR